MIELLLCFVELQYCSQETLCTTVSSLDFVSEQKLSKLMLNTSKPVYIIMLTNAEQI